MFFYAGPQILRHRVAGQDGLRGAETLGVRSGVRRAGCGVSGFTVSGAESGVRGMGAGASAGLETSQCQQSDRQKDRQTGAIESEGERAPASEPVSRLTQWCG